MSVVIDFAPNSSESIKIEQIVEEIDEKIDSDPFLRSKIDKEKLVKIFTKDPKFKSTVRSSVSPQSKKIVINVSLLNKTLPSPNSFTESRLLTQLYRIPGEEKAISLRPLVDQKLKDWYDMLKDNLFPLYSPYESALINIGVNKGVMLNHPNLVNEISDIYSHVIQTDLLKIILQNPKDLLLHYVQGIPCVWPAFLLANAKEKGEELKIRLKEVYELSHSLVIEKIIEHGNLIVENDPFNEYYYPSLSGDVNYLTLVNKYLEDSVEVGRLNTHVSRVTYSPEYRCAKLYFLDSLKEQTHIR
jgi:hypothetical protein